MQGRVEEPGQHATIPHHAASHAHPSPIHHPHSTPSHDHDTSPTAACHERAPPRNRNLGLSDRGFSTLTSGGQDVLCCRRSGVDVQVLASADGGNRLGHDVHAEARPIRVPFDRDDDDDRPDAVTGRPQNQHLSAGGASPGPDSYYVPYSSCGPSYRASETGHDDRGVSDDLSIRVFVPLFPAS